MRPHGSMRAPEWKGAGLAGPVKRMCRTQAAGAGAVGAAPGASSFGRLDRRRHRLARTAHLATGVVLMAWIVLQVAVIGLVFVLQPVMFAVGAAITALAASEPGRDDGRRSGEAPTAVDP